MHYMRHTTQTYKYSGKEIYAYCYQTSLTVIDDCSFVSNHWHLIFENTNPEQNIVFSPYAPATIPCLMTCLKFFVLPTEKNFVTHGAIVSRLQVAGENLSKVNHVYRNKNKKQLPFPNLVKRLSTNFITISNKRASTIPDVTKKPFCQLRLDDYLFSLYQIMDIRLCGQ